MSAGKIKITSRLMTDTYPYINRKVKIKHGNYCKACGSPLKDQNSIKRGYCARCFRKIPVLIILDVQP